MTILARLLCTALILTPFSGTAADTPAPTSSEETDTRLMEALITHFHTGVEMAQLGAERSVHVELEDMSVRVVLNQSADIRQMWSWLQRWYGVLAAEPSDATRLRERLEALSGAEFEVAYMQSLMQHHVDGIRLARECADRTSRTELQRLCRQMVENQAADLADMNTWICDWYTRCR